MQYLADLNRTQEAINQTQAQVTSGKQVEQASDAPAEVAEILQMQANIAQNQQVQTNLGSATAELNGADTALQTAVSIIQQAQSLAVEGATSTSTAETRAELAQQVSGLQAELVGISQTQVDGRYIFSGDQDTEAPYQLDSSQPEGVQQLVTAPATRTITDASGTTIAVALTAQQIFDPQNSNNTPATGNTFAAINDLLTSLQNNDQAGVQTAATELQSANAYVNQQMTFYGEAENRISDATTLAQKFQTQQQTDLGNLQDTDIPTAAVALNQEQVQMQAATSVEAGILQMRNIFSYLG